MKVGTIPFRRGPEGLQVCLVSTAHSRKRFTFPKGVAKRREPWRKGALRELREEAGVEGRILEPRYPLVLADEKRPSDGIVLYWCEVLSLDDAWDEDGFRKRIFRPADRLPKEKLGRTGGEVFREILSLDLGDERRAGSVTAGIAARIRAQLTGLRLRPNAGAVSEP